VAIYGRWGSVVTIVREGTLEDVRKLDQRKPDKQDKQAQEAGSYVVVRFEDGMEQLYHLGFLRADDGFAEVVRGMRAAGIKNRVTDPE